MKTYFKPFIVIVACFMAISYGCDNDDEPQPHTCIEGTGGIVTQTINLPSTITGFNMTIAADVILTQGATQEVKIEAQQNIIDNIRTGVIGNQWDIKFDDCVDSYDDIKIYITLPKLEYINVTGAGNISSTNTFDASDNLEIEFTGAGSITLDVNTKDLDIVLSGAGDINMVGFAMDQHVTLTGDGNYKAFNLASKTCVIVVSGVGNCEVHVMDFLDVTITGVGNVFYKGNPAIDVSISGTGKLIDSN